MRERTGAPWKAYKASIGEVEVVHCFQASEEMEAIFAQYPGEDVLKGWNTGRIHHVEFWAKDLDGFKARLEANGVTFTERKLPDKYPGRHVRPGRHPGQPQLRPERRLRQRPKRLRFPREGPMSLELVSITTSDGVRLDGTLRRPDAGVASRLGVDAVILHHGFGGNFYARSFFAQMQESFAAEGVAVLRVNNRGRDFAFPSPKGLLGGGYELQDDSRLDWRAWVDLAESLGYQRVLLWGQSLGAVKTILLPGDGGRPARALRHRHVAAALLLRRRDDQGGRRRCWRPASQAQARLIAEGKAARRWSTPRCRATSACSPPAPTSTSGARASATTCSSSCPRCACRSWSP